MPKEKTEYKFELLRIGIYALMIGSFLFQWFGPGLIQKYKHKKEMDRFWRGGSQSEAYKVLNAYNVQVTRFNQIIDSAYNKNPHVLVFTNDSTLRGGKIRPKINYEVFRAHGLGITLIQKKKSEIDEMATFAKYKDSIGFNVFLQNEDRDIHVMHLNNKDEDQKYKVLTFYYHSEEQKQHLRNRIEKQPGRMFIYPYKSKEEQIKELEKLQFSKVLLSETELRNKTIQNNTKALFAPRKGSIDPTHKFYFTAYNKQISKEQFKEKVKQFVAMFLDKQNPPECFTQEIMLAREE